MLHLLPRICYSLVVLYSFKLFLVVYDCSTEISTHLGQSSILSSLCSHIITNIFSNSFGIFFVKLSSLENNDKVFFFCLFNLHTFIFSFIYYCFRLRTSIPLCVKVTSCTFLFHFFNEIRLLPKLPQNEKYVLLVRNPILSNLLFPLRLLHL